MKSIINKVVFGIVWLIVHIIFLTLLIIFTIHQIMIEQSPEWIQVLFVCLFLCCYSFNSNSNNVFKRLA